MPEAFRMALQIGGAVIFMKKVVQLLTLERSEQQELLDGADDGRGTGMHLLVIAMLLISRTFDLARTECLC